MNKMNTRISITSERRTAMDRPLPSAKSHKFPVGAKIAIIGKRDASFKDENGKDLPNDKLEVEVTNAGDENGKYLFPVREYLKATIADGSEDLFTEEAGATYFPSAFTITASADRKDRDGNEVYPVNAYNAFEDQIAAGNIDWTELVASGVKDDNKLSPVQNYTVNIEG